MWGDPNFGIVLNNGGITFVLHFATLMSATDNSQNVLSQLPDAGLSAGVSLGNVNQNMGRNAGLTIAAQPSVSPGQMRRIDSNADSVAKSQSIYNAAGAVAAAAVQGQAGVPGEINNKNGQSMISFGSGSSSATAHGKELVETAYFKFKGTIWNWFSLVNNIILLIVLLELANPAGLFFNIGPDIFTHGYARADRSCSHASIAAPSSSTFGCIFCTLFPIKLLTRRWAHILAT